MFDVIKKLLFARQLSLEEGEIKLLGQNVTMLPIALFIQMYKELKTIQPKKYKKIIYNITKETGKEYSITLKKKYGMNAKKLIEWDINTLALAGLGKGELINLDLKNKKSMIRVFNSTVAKAFGRSKEPVDTVIEGYIAGSAIIIFNSEKMLCKETKCEAKGNAFCLFEVYEAK